MELRSTDIYLGRFKEANISLNITLGWDESEWCWHYHLYRKNDIFMTGSVHNTHCKNVIFEVDKRLRSVGIYLPLISGLRFLQRIIIPSIKNNPYHKWIIHNNPEVINQIEWNMYYQPTPQNLRPQTSLRL